MLVIIDESAKEVVKIDREEKLKELMDGYSKLVFSICYRLTNDYFTAEDLTQETFLSAYSSLDRFDGRNERAWLSRKARRRERRPRRMTNWSSEPAPHRDSRTNI